MNEFKAPKSVEPNSPKDQFQWLYTNGLLGIIFSFGLLYTALRSRRARSWLYGTGISSLLQPGGLTIFYIILTCSYSFEYLIQGVLEAS